MYDYNDYSNETSQSQSRNSYDYARYQAPRQSYYQPQPQYNSGRRNYNEVGLLKLIVLVVLGVIVASILLHSWVFWALVVLGIVLYSHRRHNRFHGRY